VYAFACWRSKRKFRLSLSEKIIFAVLVPLILVAGFVALRRMMFPGGRKSWRSLVYGLTAGVAFLILALLAVALVVGMWFEK
jgi:hypothetical protein